jgi:hypothetical protein
MALLRYAFAAPQIEFGGGDRTSSGTITALGFIKKLESRYHGSESEASSDSLLQMRTILDTYLTNGTAISGTGPSMPEAKDSKKTAMAHINELMGYGDVDGKELVIKIDRNLYASIEKLDDLQRYIIYPDSTISTKHGVIIENHTPIYGVYAEIAGIPSSLLTESRVIIDGCKYSASDNRRELVLQGTDDPLDIGVQQG